MPVVGPGQVRTSGWTEIPEDKALTTGKTYRVTLWLRIPYSLELAEAMSAAIQFGNGVRNINPFLDLQKKVRIKTIYWGNPVSDVQDGRYGLWPFLIEMEKLSEGTAAVVIFGAILLIITSTWGFVVVTRQWAEFSPDIKAGVSAVGIGAFLLIGLALIGGLKRGAA